MITNVYIGQIQGTLPSGSYSGGTHSRAIIICYWKGGGYTGGYQEYYNHNTYDGYTEVKKWYRTYDSKNSTWNAWIAM